MGRPVDVLEVVPGTPSHTVLLVGDQIISVGGVAATEGAQHASDCLSSLPAGKHAVVVRRGKKATQAAESAARRLSSVVNGRVSIRRSSSMTLAPHQRTLATTRVDVVSQSAGEAVDHAACTHSEQSDGSVHSLSRDETEAVLRT